MGTKTWHKHCRECVASLGRQERSARRNITVINALNEIYRCNVCAIEWTPQREAELQNIRWYWRCPNGCNHNGVRLEPGERSCTHCGDALPLNQFRNTERTATGYRCKRCCAALARQSRAASRNLTVVDSVKDEYRCNTCGSQWIPQLKPGQKHMKGWWRCPSGCNS